MALFHRIKPRFTEDLPEGEVLLAAGMRSAGDALRQQRLALGLQLNEVAEALRIKPAYLAAIEEGRPDQLPGAAYAVGFVRSYSEHLGLDGDEILRRFKLEAEGLDAKPELTFPMPLGERSLPGGWTLAAAVVLAIAAYGVWYHLVGERSPPPRVTEVPAELLRPNPAPVKPPHTPAASAVPHPNAAAVAAGSGSAGPATKPSATAMVVTPADLPPTAPSATGAAAPPVGAAAPITMPLYAAAPSAGPVSSPAVPVSATPPAAAAASAPAAPPIPAAAAANPTEALASPAPAQSGAAPVEGPARILLRANADSWIQIRAADHSVLFTGVLKPGDTYRVPDEPGLSMRAGNAGGLDVTVDGKPAPSLGPLGAVRNVALDPQSLMKDATTHD